MLRQKMFRKKQGYRLNTLIRGGDKMLQWISALPDNVVNNIFTTINTLICGLIVAFFTSTFLKKKEERTRIAGVIVEKRINSEQDILHYLVYLYVSNDIHWQNH